MKLITCFLCLFASISSFCQKEKWFASFSVGGGVGGPASSIKSQMKAKGFDDVETTNLIILNLDNDNYPRKSVKPSLLLRAGARINPMRSLYFVVGMLEQGQVTGFRRTGTAYGSTIGVKPNVHYTIWQFAGGFLFDDPGSTIRFGIAPAVFYVPYSTNYAKDNSVVPGGVFTARFALGKQKAVAGLDLNFDLVLAPPVKMDIKMQDADGFSMSKASMIQFCMGLAFTIRGKK